MGAEVVRDIETGNQSGKQGELSLQYQLVKQINEEIDHQAAEKEDAVELKRKLEEMEGRIVAGETRPRQRHVQGPGGWGATVDVDGTISGSSYKYV